MTQNSEQEDLVTTLKNSFNIYLNEIEQSITQEDQKNLQLCLNQIIDTNYDVAKDYLKQVTNDSKYKDLLITIINSKEYREKYHLALKEHTTVRELCLNILTYFLK